MPTGSGRRELLLPCQAGSAPALTPAAAPRECPGAPGPAGRGWGCWLRPCRASRRQRVLPLPISHSCDLNPRPEHAQKPSLPSFPLPWQKPPRSSLCPGGGGERGPGLRGSSPSRHRWRWAGTPAETPVPSSPAGQRYRSTGTGRPPTRPWE